MGVKSTMRITRERAEAMYQEFRSREFERMFKAEAVMLTNTQLEDRLEEMNDNYFREQYGSHSTGFDNYIICANPDEEDRW